jgi:hypothetical protein
VEVVWGSDATQIKQSEQEIDGAIKKSSKGIKQWAKDWQYSITWAADKMGQLAKRVQEVARASIDEMAKFETQMLRVGALGTLEQGGLGELADWIEDASVRLGRDAPQLMSVMEQLQSAWGKGSINLSKQLIEAGRDLDVLSGGVMGMDQATMAVSKSMKVYGDELDSVGKAQDWLFSIYKQGEIQLDEIADSLEKVGSRAKIAGVGSDELGAAIATLTANAGMSAGMLRESFGSSLVALDVAWTKHAKLLKSKGVDIEKGLEGFTEKIEALRDAGGELDTAFWEKLVGREGMGFISELVANFGAYEEKLRGIGEATGIVDEAVKPFNKSLAEQQKQWDAIKEVGLRLISQFFTPAVGELAKLAEKLNENREAAEKYIDLFTKGGLLGEMGLTFWEEVAKPRDFFKGETLLKDLMGGDIGEKMGKVFGTRFFGAQEELWKEKHREFAETNKKMMEETGKTIGEVMREDETVQTLDDAKEKLEELAAARELDTKLSKKQADANSNLTDTVNVLTDAQEKKLQTLEKSFQSTVINQMLNDQKAQAKAADDQAKATDDFSDSLRRMRYELAASRQGEQESIFEHLKPGGGQKRGIRGEVIGGGAGGGMIPELRGLLPGLAGAEAQMVQRVIGEIKQMAPEDQALQQLELVETIERLRDKQSQIAGHAEKQNNSFQSIAVQVGALAKTPEQLTHILQGLEKALTGADKRIALINESAVRLQGIFNNLSKG